MLKRVLIYVISAALIFALFGCGTPAQTDSSPAAPAEQSAQPGPSSASADAGSEVYYSFDYNGTERTYLLHIPEGIKENAPLVCVLHGYGGDAKGIMQLSGMNSVADEYGFAVVYPQGLPAKYESAYCWNAGGLVFAKEDDTGFLAALMEDLQQRYSLSSEATFAAGFSNGGFMCYKLAQDAPDTFRAVASVAGTMSGQTWNERGETVSVPLLQIHGTYDDVIPIDGNITTGGGLGGAPAMSEVIEYWAEAIGANELETAEISDKADACRYSSNESDAQVWYYVIEGYPHSWPRMEDAGFDASALIWEFFSNYVD